MPAKGRPCQHTYFISEVPMLYIVQNNRAYRRTGASTISTDQW